MRRVASLFAVLLALVGCSGIKPPEGTTIKPQRAAQQAVDDAYEAAPDGSEWLLNTKHTLAGMTLEAGSDLLQNLLKNGAISVRVGDIRPDPKDPSFESAGALFVEMPGAEPQRSKLLAFAANIQGLQPEADSGQKHIQIRIVGEAR